ncbi:MAG: hypothetical protein F7C34_05455 [Desulfurococcales archaeon]|nr:hypothetical protein [Desulfurococcales archaeon]
MPKARSWAPLVIAILLVLAVLPTGSTAESGLPSAIPSPSWYATIRGEHLRSVEIVGSYIVTFSQNMSASVIRVYNASTGEEMAKAMIGVSMFAEPYPLISASEHSGRYYIAFFDQNEAAVILELPGLNTVLRADPPGGFSHVYGYGLLQTSPDTLLAVYKASNATQQYTLLAIATPEGMHYDTVKGEPISWCADDAQNRILVAVKTGSGSNSTVLTIYTLSSSGSQVLVNETYEWKPRKWAGEYLASFNPGCSMLALAVEAGGTNKLVVVDLEGNTWSTNLTLIPLDTLRWSPLGTYIVVGVAASDTAVNPEKVLFIPLELLTHGTGEIYTYEPPSPAVIDEIDLYTVEPHPGESMDVAFVKLTHTPVLGAAEIVVPATGYKLSLQFAYAATSIPGTDRLAVAVKGPVQQWASLEIYAVSDEGAQHQVSYMTFVPGLPKTVTTVPGAESLVVAAYSGTSLSGMTNIISRLDWHNATMLLQSGEKAILAVPYLRGYSWSYQGSLSEADGYRASVSYTVDVSQSIVYVYYKEGQNWTLAQSVPGIVARVNVSLADYSNVEAVKITLETGVGGLATAYNSTGARLPYSSGSPTLTLTPDHASETVILIVPVTNTVNLPGPGSEPVKLNMTVVPVQQTGETTTSGSAQTTQQSAGPTGTSAAQTSPPEGTTAGSGGSGAGVPAKTIAVIVLAVIVVAAAALLYYRR